MNKLKLLFTLIVILAASSIQADTYGDWEFYVTNLDSVCIVGYVGEDNPTSITIPSEVIYNGETFYVASVDGVFNDNSFIERVTIPSTVRHIKNSFNDCTNLSSVTFNDGLLSIGELSCISASQNDQGEWDYIFGGSSGCFCNDSKLRYVSLPSTIKELWGAFNNCSLVMVGLNEGLEFISGFAYNQIQELTLPSSLLEIWDDSFRGNPFSTVLIPEKVRKINTGGGAFHSYGFLDDGGGVAAINVSSSNPYYTSINGVLFNKDCTELIFYPQRKEGDTYKVLDGVKDVGYAFYSNFKLKSLELSDDIEEIKSNAFFSCHFETIKLPQNIKKIGYGAFEYCTHLESIDIPENIESIGSLSFSFWCGPNPVTCRNTTPPECADDAFTFGTLYVPSESVELYKSSSPWSKFSTIKAIGEEESTTLVSAIELTPANLNLVFGESSALTATVTPSDASTQTLSWTSSNTAIATVDNGVITAVGAGKATVTATTTDGSNISASCEVTVTETEIPSSVEASTDVSLYDNILYFDDVESRAGNSITLPLQMKNASEEIVGFQFDMQLPDGVTLDKNARGKYSISFDSEADRTSTEYHTVSGADQSDGTIRVLCYSTGNELILGTIGAVLDLPLTLAESMEAGDYNIVLTNVVMTTAASQKYTLNKVVSKLTIPSYTIGDANGDDVIDVADISSIAGYILGSGSSSFVKDAADIDEDGVVDVADIAGTANIILYGSSSSSAKAMSKMMLTSAPSTAKRSLEVVPFAIANGTTSQTVTLDLTNPNEEFTGFQCDIVFPDGISLTKNARGKYSVSFNSETDRTSTDYHTASAALQSDGSMRILCYSTTNEVFLDESGAILNLPLTISSDIEAGIYDIQLNNITLSKTDGSKVTLDNYKLSVFVGSPTLAGNIKLYGDFTNGAIAAANNCLADNTDITSVDMSGAFAITSGNTINVENPNAVIYIPSDATLNNSKNVIVGENCDNLDITDGYTFTIPTGFTASAASYSRNMSYSFGTICLPYEVTSDVTIQYYQLASVSENSMSFEPVSSVAAGTPAVFKVLSGTTANMSAENVSVSAGSNEWNGTLSGNSWTMTGTMAAVNIDPTTEENDIYYIADNKFWYANKAFDVPTFRGWFETPKSSSPAKSFNIAIWEDTPTGVNYVENVDGTVDVIFDIAGRKQSSAKSGINIINGKKVFVK